MTHIWPILDVFVPENGGLHGGIGEQDINSDGDAQIADTPRTRHVNVGNTPKHEDAEHPHHHHHHHHHPLPYAHHSEDSQIPQVGAGNNIIKRAVLALHSFRERNPATVGIHKRQHLNRCQVKQSRPQRKARHETPEVRQDLYATKSTRAGEHTQHCEIPTTSTVRT